MLDLECWDGVRRDMLILLLRSIEARYVPGQFAELGVYRGGTAKLIHHYCPNRQLHLFDTFSGFDVRDTARDLSVASSAVDASLFKDTGVELVRKAIASSNESIQFHQGYFPETFCGDLEKEIFAFVHLDADLYAPTYSGLICFYPRLSPGGIILVHDYNAWLGARQAVDDFCNNQGLVAIPMPDKSGSCVIIKV